MCFDQIHQSFVPAHFSLSPPSQCPVWFPLPPPQCPIWFLSIPLPNVPSGSSLPPVHHHTFICFLSPLSPGSIVCAQDSQCVSPFTYAWLCAPLKNTDFLLSLPSIVNSSSMGLGLLRALPHPCWGSCQLDLGRSCMCSPIHYRLMCITITVSFTCDLSLFSVICLCPLVCPVRCIEL